MWFTKRVMDQRNHSLTKLNLTTREISLIETIIIKEATIEEANVVVIVTAVGIIIPKDKMKVRGVEEVITMREEGVVTEVEEDLKLLSRINREI